MSVECPVFGDKSYLTLADEAVFGVEDAEPAYVYLPVTNYGIELLSDKRDPVPYTGMAQKYDKIIGAQHTAGPIATARHRGREAALSRAKACVDLLKRELDVGPERLLHQPHRFADAKVDGVTLQAAWMA